MPVASVLAAISLSPMLTAADILPNAFPSGVSTDRQKTDEPTGEILFKGEWGERRPFHQAVFSVATGIQVADAKHGSPTGKAVDNPLLQTALENIASPVFRLPGGDRLNDHDYFEDEISLADWKRMSGFGNSVPLWGVNVTTAATEHTERLARALIALGANTEYFELGNELYLDRWREQTATAHEYFEKAAPHRAVLKKHFPNAKLGSPGASFWGVVEEGRPDVEFGIRSEAQLHPWLQDMLANQAFYDAIVLHMYLTPKEFGIGGLKDRTPEDLARWAWVRSDGELLKRIFGTVHDLAPGKEIWVTEWAFNSNQYISRVTDVEWQVHQTMLAMLYDARFMLNTAYHVPYVTIMTCWTLYTSPAICLITAEGATTVKYDLYRFLRWAREGSDRLSRLQITNNPVWRGPPGGQGYDKYSSEVGEVFGFFKGEHLNAAVILNILDREVSVEVPGLVGAKQGLSLTQESLIPGWGDRGNPPVTEWNPPREVRPLKIAGETVTVPPHSISVVHTKRGINETF